VADELAGMDLVGLEARRAMLFTELARPHNPVPATDLARFGT
jgi:hypothetical protein